MAVDFTNIETTNWIGQVNGLPTTLCGQSGRTVSVNIDWRLYQVGPGESLGVSVDMTGIAPSNQLDLIRSVYIDNLDSDNDIYVWFPDTGFTAPCKKNSAAWVPVVTNVRQATIYGLEFANTTLPKVLVIFTNIMVQYSSQEIEPTTQANTIQVAQSAAMAGVAPAQNGTFQFVFPGVSLGETFFGRQLAIAAAGSIGSPCTGYTVSVTGIEVDIGSGYTAATLIGTAMPTNLVSNVNRFGIYSNDNAVSANIRVTLTYTNNCGSGGAGLQAIIAVYSINGAADAIPEATAEATLLAPGSITINVPQNGCVIASQAFRNGTANMGNVNPDGRIGAMQNGHNNFGSVGLLITTANNTGQIRAISFGP